MEATIAVKTTTTSDPAPILVAAPLRGLGFGLVVAPPAAEVAEVGETNTMLTLGSPVPVPATPPDEADPVG